MAAAAVAVAVRWCVACHWPVAIRHPPALPSYHLMSMVAAAAAHLSLGTVVGTGVCAIMMDKDSEQELSCKCIQREGSPYA